MSLGLIRTVLREMATPVEFSRIPEANLVMDDAGAVEAFDRASQPNGILSAIYAYNIGQSCSVIEPNDTVLDLGCGPATLLLQTARLNPAAKFIGIDLSSEMISRGKGVIERGKIGNVELRIDDIVDLRSLESKSVDVVLSSMALHHLPTFESLERCFVAIDRVLRPSGRVYICDFGRLKHLRSVEYFVGRAIPKDEPILERDYRMSLQAAFTKEEFQKALGRTLGNRAAIYSTAVSALLIIVKSEGSSTVRRAAKAELNRLIDALPSQRRLDFFQLRAFLRLGGLRWVA